MIKYIKAWFEVFEEMEAVFENEFTKKPIIKGKRNP
jgi:hypothetical protein